MTAWQSNLFNNLIVIFVLLALFIIVYCKVAGKTLLDVITDIKGAFSPDEQF